MRLEHHLVGRFVRYISPHIIIIINVYYKDMFIYAALMLWFTYQQYR